MGSGRALRLDRAALCYKRVAAMSVTETLDVLPRLEATAHLALPRFGIAPTAPLALRSRFPSGTLRVLAVENWRVLAAWRGPVPVEVIGGASFPAVGERPYAFTLGPHTILWCRLESC